MILRGINFGPCLDASGVRGFYGDGYWFRRLPGLSKMFSLTGSTFVAKTVTWHKWPGNTLIQDIGGRFEPKHFFPDSIWFNPFTGDTVNSVGLSNPGAMQFLASSWTFRLQNERPFMISFMPTPSAKSKEERCEEFRTFVRWLRAYLAEKSWLRKQIGLQLNINCPNTGHDSQKLTGEAIPMLDIAEEEGLNVPIVVKINLLVDFEILQKIDAHPSCDAICVTNTIPFWEHPDIPWSKLFPKGSPIKYKGGGGLSGPRLLPLVTKWVEQALEREGIKKPLNVGGGIWKPVDIDTLVEAGLRPGIDSVFLGTVCMLRPWRVQPIIRRAHELLA